MQRIFVSVLLSIFFLTSACEKKDTQSPVLILYPDTVIHYLQYAFIEPGFEVLDNHSCDLENEVIIQNPVDVNNYGSYTITYTITDEGGNTTTEERPVDIILHKNNYYHLTYAATDTCTSGIYNYSGLIQDCDCPQNVVTVANISNFGLSAIFTLPITGQYNEIIVMDTSKAAVSFIGEALMSTNADTLFWKYTIADSVSADVCTSVWIKE